MPVLSEYDSETPHYYDNQYEPPSVINLYDTPDITLNIEINIQKNVKSSSSNDNDDKADINTREKENIKDIENYQRYQQTEQDDQPWASDRDIRIVESDKMPNPNPITDTEGCPECGNTQAYWWIVQTDSGDEPSTQFFRCTECNHTWRTTKSSL